MRPAYLQTRLYGTERWRKIAAHQMRKQPLCVMCLERGQITPAQVADHIEPWKDSSDPNAFWFGKLQSLCASCHSGAKAEVEKRGYRTDIGVDGMPLDPKHPVYLRDRD
jgi:5-methylcytosine-specific restriction enzyme A